MEVILEETISMSLFSGQLFMKHKSRALQPFFYFVDSDKGHNCTVSLLKADPKGFSSLENGIADCIGLKIRQLGIMLVLAN